MMQGKQIDELAGFPVGPAMQDECRFVVKTFGTHGQVS
jgi:hypothetical protein